MEKKKRLQDIKVNGKWIILRCDFNVPIQNGQILDDKKIVASLETIEYLQERDCRIVILSHLGKVKSEEDKRNNTLEPVALRLNELLGTPISFSKQTRNVELATKVRSMEAGDILLLENTRHEDYPNKLESNSDSQLAMYWASLGDIFVNDAFASAHRVHASTAGIAKYIPSCIGFLMQKEIDMLDTYVLNAEKPFSVIMGGIKVADKIQMIEKLLPKCEYLLLGGGLANHFLHALGLNTGFIDIEMTPEFEAQLKTLMYDNRDKIMLPLDVVTTTSYDNKRTNYRLIDKIEDNDLVYDIGSKTIDKFKGAIQNSRTVFLNGTMGVYEDQRFSNGTRMLLNALAKSPANVVVGGGDGVSATRLFGFENKMTYLCTGGGATLEYIANETLPALNYIEKADNKEETSNETLGM